LPLLACVSMSAWGIFTSVLIDCSPALLVPSMNLVI
jgi:hypothetical protein